LGQKKASPAQENQALGNRNRWSGLQIRWHGDVAKERKSVQEVVEEIPVLLRRQLCSLLSLSQSVEAPPPLPWFFPPPASPVSTWSSHPLCPRRQPRATPRRPSTICRLPDTPAAAVAFFPVQKYPRRPAWSEDAPDVVDRGRAGRRQAGDASPTAAACALLCGLAAGRWEKIRERQRRVWLVSPRPACAAGPQK
jgi:hypothetical protein